MVEYMRAFLEPFRTPPYTVEPAGSNWYRISNTVSGFSAIVRGYRGEVQERVPALDGSGWRWKLVSATHLQESLGICEERG